MERLAADSPRRAAARKFGIALTIAMRDNGTNGRRLARTLGITTSAIYVYRSGGNLPSLETAARFADVLGHPNLVAIVAAGRSGKCEFCGRPFTSAVTAGNRRFCTARCRVRAYHRPSRDTAPKRVAIAERTAASHIAAVDAFCKSCEPELVCRTADCPLRIVSPLPLARRRTA